jgi:ParB family chromosome partitioning protein
MSDTIVKVSEVRPDPRQPRKYFNEAALKSLARSLQLVGQRTPISVKPLQGDSHRFEIIDGERRWRACQLAGMETIRVTVEEQPLDRRRQHLLSTISNFHREGHTHIEISDALFYQKSLGASVGELAENLAKSESWVYQYLGLQSLAADLKDKMQPDVDADVQIRFAEAVVLASLPQEKQRALYREGRRFERGERIVFYRKRAGLVQGRVRTGRPMRPSEQTNRYASFVKSMNHYLDVALDLKEKEFEQILRSAKPQEVDRLTERLQKLRDDIGIVLDVAKRANGPKARAA